MIQKETIDNKGSFIFLRLKFRVGTHFVDRLLTIHSGSSCSRQKALKYVGLI